MENSKNKEIKMLDWEELLKYMFESSIMPLIIVDKNGVVIKINHAYEQWAGIAASDIEGFHVTEKVENAHIHVVAATGIHELHVLQHCFGKTILSNRLPIYDDKGVLLGAWGNVEFDDYSAIDRLIQKIEKQEKSIRQYENELKTFKVGKYSFDDILGDSSQIQYAKKDSLLIALEEIDVIIRGETGTGKELFAHSIHNASSRRDGPFISINCSALSVNLVEAELFGYESGSFTDADKSGKKGKFELANGGTLFLDEIGDMPISIQPKLLRAIQEREVTRIGGSKVIPLDIRIIAATNRDLETMKNQGMFRDDLYYRMTSFTILIPSLRERKEDILILADYFVKEECKKRGRQVKSFSNDSKNKLFQYDWPGNVRELHNYIRQLIIKADPQEPYYSVDLNSNSSSDVARSQASEPFKKYDDYEENLFRSILKETNYNISKTAGILKIDRNTVYRKMNKYGIKKSDYKK